MVLLVWVDCSPPALVQMPDTGISISGIPLTTHEQINYQSWVIRNTTGQTGGVSIISILHFTVHFLTDSPTSLYLYYHLFQWAALACGDSGPTLTSLNLLCVCVNLLQGWAPSTRSSSPATLACVASPCRWSATSQSWTTTARRKPTTRRCWRRAGWGPSTWRSWCPAWWLGWSTTTTPTDSVAEVTEVIL